MNSLYDPPQPRLPTSQEKDEVWHYLCREYAFEAQADFSTEGGQIKAMLEDAAIAVFDHFMSDCPGFCGKLMVVIWPGGPSMREVFGWETIRNGDTVSYQLNIIPCDAGFCS